MSFKAELFALPSYDQLETSLNTDRLAARLLIQWNGQHFSMRNDETRAVSVLLVVQSMNWENERIADNPWAIKNLKIVKLSENFCRLNGNENVRKTEKPINFWTRIRMVSGSLKTEVASESVWSSPQSSFLNKILTERSELDSTALSPFDIPSDVQANWFFTSDVISWTILKQALETVCQQSRFQKFSLKALLGATTKRDMSRCDAPTRREITTHENMLHIEEGVKCCESFYDIKTQAVVRRFLFRCPPTYSHFFSHFISKIGWRRVSLSL